MNPLSETPRDSPLEARFRLILCALAVATFVVIPAELILLGHTQSVAQWIPFVACFFGLVASGWVVVDPVPARLRGARLLSRLIVLSGMVGAFMHLRANLLLQLEIRPNETWSEAMWPALQGSAAFLAPGILILGALLVLGATYDHPVLTTQKAR